MLSNNDLRGILYPIFNEEKIKEISLHYEEYKKLPLQEIGIDSLSLLSLILNIENYFHIQIDFTQLDSKKIDSLERIEFLINEKKNN